MTYVCAIRLATCDFLLGKGKSSRNNFAVNVKQLVASVHSFPLHFLNQVTFDLELMPALSQALAMACVCLFVCLSQSTVVTEWLQARIELIFGIRVELSKV